MNAPQAPPRQIASPKYLTSLSPVNSYLTRSEELKHRGFNVNTQAQKSLLKYAVAPENLDRIGEIPDRVAKEDSKIEDESTHGKINP